MGNDEFKELSLLHRLFIQLQSNIGLFIHVCISVMILIIGVPARTNDPTLLKKAAKKELYGMGAITKQ